MKARVKKAIIVLLLAALICVVYYLFVSKTKVGLFCIFERITGARCAGCGNTRAVVSLLQGDIGRAFSYNYMFLAEIGYIGAVLISYVLRYIRYGEKQIGLKPEWLNVVILVVFLAWWIVRNIIGV